MARVTDPARSDPASLSVEELEQIREDYAIADRFPCVSNYVMVSRHIERLLDALVVAQAEIDQHHALDSTKRIDDAVAAIDWWRQKCAAAQAENERQAGIIKCLTRQWPDCVQDSCGQPCSPFASERRGRA